MDKINREMDYLNRAYKILTDNLTLYSAENDKQEEIPHENL